MKKESNYGILTGRLFSFVHDCLTLNLHLELMDSMKYVVARPWAQPMSGDKGTLISIKHKVKGIA